MTVHKTAQLSEQELTYCVYASWEANKDWVSGTGVFWQLQQNKLGKFSPNDWAH